MRSKALPVLKGDHRRCTGHCCRSFFLPYSPRTLRRRKKTTLEDGDQIVKMIIHLGRFKENPLCKINDSGDDQWMHFYT